MLLKKLRKIRFTSNNVSFKMKMKLRCVHSAVANKAILRDKMIKTDFLRINKVRGN